MLLSYCVSLSFIFLFLWPLQALSFSRTSLISPCWICPKWLRWPWVTNGFLLQASSVIDWHNYKSYFWVDAQKYIGWNVFILNGVPNKPNIQLNLSPVHRQNGRVPCLWDGSQGKLLLPAALWPPALCQKLSYISESSDLFCLYFYIWITGIILLLCGVPSCSSVILKFTSEDTLQHFFFSPVPHHSCFSLPWLKIMGLVKVKEFFWVLKPMKIICFTWHYQICELLGTE